MRGQPTSLSKSMNSLLEEATRYDDDDDDDDDDEEVLLELI